MKFIPVGYWCRTCEDLLPQENRLCRCMDFHEKLENIEAFKKKQWLPVFAHIPKYGSISPFD